MQNSFKKNKVCEHFAIRRFVQKELIRTILIVFCKPFGIGSRRFVQAQRVQLHIRRQRSLQARSKVGEHILAGWLIIDQNNLLELRSKQRLQLNILLRVAQHKRVVEPIDYLAIDNALQVAEIHHHTQFWAFLVARRLTLNGNEKTI